MYSGLPYVFKGVVGNPSNVNVETLLLKDSRLGEWAIDWGKQFQTDIVLGKKGFRGVSPKVH